MSNEVTKRMLSVYEERREPTKFFTGLFQSPAENFHNSKEVEIDIVRSGEDISVVVQDLSDSGRYNSQDFYTNKSFVPPVHKEQGPLNAFDLLNRTAGNDPFVDMKFQAAATMRAASLIAKMTNKIRRSIELQGAQVMQTGIVDLKDKTGTTLYILDYKAKATHIFSVSTVWSNAAATPLNDIEEVSDVIRADSGHTADQLIMGQKAFNDFLENGTVKERADIRRYEVVQIAPVAPNSDGGKFQGVVTIGNYQYDIWTYAGFYKDPQTGNTLPYMDPNKVIVRASTGRLDATFGGIPSFGAVARPALPFLPARFASVGNAMDIFNKAWLTENGEQIIVAAGSRPLLIPTAIDSYGCLTTGV